MRGRKKAESRLEVFIAELGPNGTAGPSQYLSEAAYNLQSTRKAASAKVRKRAERPKSPRNHRATCTVVIF